MRRLAGTYPEKLVSDSTFSSRAVLGQIDGLGIGFLALQRRDQGLGSQLRARPAAQWCQVQLHNVGRKHLEPLVLDQRTGIGGYLKTLRRLAADGLGSGARCCRSTTTSRRARAS